MSKTKDQSIIDYVTETRDKQRPNMQLVVDVLEHVFVAYDNDSEIIKIVDGPDQWIWEDTMLSEKNLPKFYVLSRSTSPGTEGYPMLTIRQAYSVRLDAWITSSSLVIGPTENDISRSLALSIANQAGSFAGFRHSVNAVVAAGGDPLAGLDAVKELQEMSVDITAMVNKMDSKPEEMN